MKSHTGMYMTLGKGATYTASCKRKLNTKSSMEAELVAVNDAMGDGTSTMDQTFLRSAGSPRTNYDNIPRQHEHNTIG